LTKKRPDGSDKAAIRYYKNMNHAQKDFRTMNANHLEAVIWQFLCESLASLSCDDIGINGLIDIELRQHLARLSENKGDTLKHLLQKVIIEQGNIAITINISMMKHWINSHKWTDEQTASSADRTSSASLKSFSKPMSVTVLKGGKKQIILQEHDASQAPPIAAISAINHPSLTHKDMLLIDHIKLSFQWQKQLMKDPKITLKTLAMKSNIEPSNANKVARLCFLAPNIIQKIMSGRQPIHLTLAFLRKPFPEEWHAQYQHFGIEG